MRRRALYSKGTPKFPVDNLIQYYEFEETSGNIIDSYGGVDLTDFNVTRGVEGKNGFGHETGYITINTTGLVSLSFWLKRTGSVEYILDFRSARNLYLLENTATPSGFEKMYFNGNEVESVTANHLTGTTGWQHIYLELSTSFTGNFKFLSRFNQSSFFVGFSDKLSLHNSALTHQEIRAIYNNGEGIGL
jgi:hypothetical protein